ncbi:MAG: hypothetical protein IIA60_01690 [Candidatus Marinimicrobia bacterium]|nr:hypothetical protein [Candidatus Neomarinimicrobiota bacterium]
MASFLADWIDSLGWVPVSTTFGLAVETEGVPLARLGATRICPLDPFADRTDLAVFVPVEGARSNVVATLVSGIIP